MKVVQQKFTSFTILKPHLGGFSTCRVPALSLQICAFGHVTEASAGNLLRLVSFTLQNVFKGHPCCSMTESQTFSTFSSLEGISSRQN
jgi:hypothetical protein